MRTFTGYRPKVPERYIEGGYGNLPDEAQFQGVEFDDGTVAVRWLTQYRSTSLWPNYAEFEAVHGHSEYETRIEWHAEPPTSDPHHSGPSVSEPPTLPSEPLTFDGRPGEAFTVFGPK